MLITSKLIFVKTEYLRFCDYISRKISGSVDIKTSQITSQIFLGGQYKLKSIPKIQKLGITAIVNMRMRSVHPLNTLKGVRYLHLPTPDRMAPSLEDLKTGAAFIKDEVERGGKVYIHCMAGEGRGPTMALAYLISTGLDMDDAMKLVKKVRAFIRPTKVQLEQLKSYSKTL